MGGVFNATMRVVVSLVGVLLALMGCVWILQGINLLPGSFMTGHIQWAVFGAILAVIGAAQAVWANTRQTKA